MDLEFLNFAYVFCEPLSTCRPFFCLPGIWDCMRPKYHRKNTRTNFWRKKTRRKKTLGKSYRQGLIEHVCKKTWAISPKRRELPTLTNFEKSLNQLVYECKRVVFFLFRFPWCSFGECLWVVNVEAHAAHCQMATIVDVAISLWVHRYKLALRDRQAARGRCESISPLGYRKKVNQSPT